MNLKSTRLIAVALLLSSSLAAGAGEDAAALYRQAIEKLPRQPADLELYSRWSSATPMHQIAAETLRQCDGSFELLHRAAVVDSCNWGWAAGDAPGARAAELDSIETLARASALQIRSLFEQKRPSEATELFGDVLLLGRRMADCELPDARRAGLRVQHVAYVVVGRYLPGRPRDLLDQLSRKSAAVPDLKPMPHADDATTAAQNVNRAERALFAAAIAVARDGRAALRGAKDPFADGPFQYDVQVDGFLLRSKLTVAGAPVTLRCGPQAFE